MQISKATNQSLESFVTTNNSAVSNKLPQTRTTNGISGKRTDIRPVTERERIGLLRLVADLKIPCSSNCICHNFVVLSRVL